MKYLFCKLFFLILFFGVSCTSKTPIVKIELSKEATVLAFGDSLTRGQGVSLAASYPSQLSKITGYEVINAGVSGEVSAAGLRRLPQLIEEHSPDLIILCHGGNDFLRKKSKSQLKKNLEAMIKMIKKNNIPLIFVGVPGPGISFKTNKIYKQLAKKHKIPFAENIIAELLSQRELKSDFVHFNAKGYLKLAKEIAKYIK